MSQESLRGAREARPQLFPLFFHSPRPLSCLGRKGRIKHCRDLGPKLGEKSCIRQSPGYDCLPGMLNGLATSKADLSWASLQVRIAITCPCAARTASEKCED